MIFIAQDTNENELVKKLAKENRGRAILYEDGFATVTWSVDDIIGRERADKINREGATKFLEYYENRLKDAAMEGGNLFLDEADYSGYCVIADDEEYELIELLDKPMLFANERIRSWQVPEGLYLYHLRESDDGDRFCSIELHVGVNHGGSVLSKEPIDLGDKGYISFKGDITPPNFIGDDVSIADFIAGNFEFEF